MAEVCLGRGKAIAVAAGTSTLNGQVALAASCLEGVGRVPFLEADSAAKGAAEGVDAT